MSQPAIDFEQQVKQYQGLVFTVAFGITLNQEESLDLMQDAFLKAYQEPDFLSSAFDRKSWLVTVVRNLAFNSRKSWWKKIQLLTGYQELTMEAPNAELAELFIREETIARLREAMKHLADEEREILTLRYVVQYKYSQIAEIMGVQIGTVMSRLARLKEKLGKLLKDDLNDE